MSNPSHHHIPVANTFPSDKVSLTTGLLLSNDLTRFLRVGFGLFSE